MLQRVANMRSTTRIGLQELYVLIYAPSIKTELPILAPNYKPYYISGNVGSPLPSNFLISTCYKYTSKDS